MIMELIIQVHLFCVICWLLKYWFLVLEMEVFFEHHVQFRCGAHTACNPKDTGGSVSKEKAAGAWKRFFHVYLLPKLRMCGVLLIYVVVSTSVTLCSPAGDYYSKYQHMNLRSRKNHQSQSLCHL